MNQQAPLTAPQSFPADVQVPLTFGAPSLACLVGRVVYAISNSGGGCAGVQFCPESVVNVSGIGTNPSNGAQTAIVHFTSAPTPPSCPPGCTATLTLQVYTA